MQKILIVVLSILMFGVSALPGAASDPIAVAAPVWSIGDAWTYDVAGSLVGTPFAAKYGVVGTVSGEDAWLMGVDTHNGTGSPTPAHVFAILNGGGFWLQGVHQQSLAVKQMEVYQDFIGFDRGVGAQWEVFLFGVTFTVEKRAVETIDHALGSAPGIRVEGWSLEGGWLTVLYASDVRAIVELEWQQGNEEVLSYRLRGAEAAAVGLERWEVLQVRRATAAPVLMTIGGSQLQSDGSGDLMFLAVTASEAAFLTLARPAAGTLVSPDPTFHYEFMTDGSQPQQDTLLTSDRSGSWTMALATSGPRLDFRLMQIDVVVYG